MIPYTTVEIPGANGIRIPTNPTDKTPGATGIRIPTNPTEFGLNQQLVINSTNFKTILSKLGLDKPTFKELVGVYGAASNKSTISLSNLIALARTYGKTSQQIVDAINTVPEGAVYTVESLRLLNNAEAPSIYRSLINKINTDNPDANAYVYKAYTSDGKTRYTIRYTNADGKNVPYYLHKDDTFKENMSDAELTAWYDNSILKNDAVTKANAAANATQQNALADKVLGLIENSNLGAGANASKNLTEADIAAATAQLPTTENLQAWNQSKDKNILSTVHNDTQLTNPDLITRAGLDELQHLAKNISDEQVNTTQRNIDNQRLQLLQQIQQDPELYNAITQQLRADSAAGTIAGQRAANAQRVASEADATYDKSASELYSSLFTGDNAVANTTRDSVMKSQVDESNQYIQSMLNNAIEAARQGQITSQDLTTFVNSMITALDTDQSKYDNAIAENQAAAAGKASDISNQLEADLKKQIANEDAKVQNVQNLLGIGTDYLQSAGVADVTDALQTIIDGFNSGNAFGSGYKKVTTPEYQNAEQFTNKQYTDFINSDAFKTFLSDETIDSLTKSKTLENILSENNLDMLTEDGMRRLYEGYAKDANEQSNKVFNAAQRAYIAAVTAGDAKTTEQLTKLASNAAVSKKNLYATSAFANQLKQQFGANNTGRQLATDFQNQMSANRQAFDKAALSANSALTGFVGNGTDGYDAGTLYAVKNLQDSVAATNRNLYGKLGDKLMSTTQGLNTSNASNNINNYDRLAQLAGQYTTTNAAAAANNTANKVTVNALKNQANAMKAQAGATLNK